MFHWKSLGREYWNVDPTPWKSLTLFWEINIHGVGEECGRSWKNIWNPQKEQEKVCWVSNQVCRDENLGIFETFLIENYGVVLSTDRENTESADELVMIFNYLRMLEKAFIFLQDRRSVGVLEYFKPLQWILVKMHAGWK